MLRYEPGGIDGLYVGRSDRVGDERGWIAHVMDAPALELAGGPTLAWTDSITSRSRRGTVRGLHFRRDALQWKQIWVERGAIFDVVVDLRPWLTSYLSVQIHQLSATDRRQLIVPPGCAHGCQALSGDVRLVVSSTTRRDGALDAGISYDEPALDIRWPVSPVIVGGRDAGLPSLAAVASSFATDFADLRRVGPD